MQVCGTYNDALQSDMLVLRVLVLAEGRGSCGCAEMTSRKSVLGFERRQGAVRPMRAVPMCPYILTIALKRGRTGAEVLRDLLPVSYSVEGKQPCVLVTASFHLVPRYWRRCDVMPN
jgi:hypothetical protein